MIRPVWVALVCCGSLLWSAGGARAGLIDYVKKPEPKFSWKLKQEVSTPQGTAYELELVSQEWHGISWTHQLQIYQAPEAKPSSTMLLWNTGGKANLLTITFGLDLSRKLKAPVAFLYGIPNQPLLGDKKEDALIAETFVRALDTKDDTWPLLFPMVKSVVKALDALQAFGKEKWRQAPEHFIISGGSKRGWTAWLSGAVDPRIKAIAPMVIDTLNMVEQMKHQKESFGTFSEMIRDYTARGLVPLPKTEAAQKLWQMVDPFFYRDRLKVPKLIINGNNDPYWTVDALNLYWDGLEGEKYIVYVANAGHDLKQAGSKPGEERSKAVNALAAFSRAQMTGKALPRLEWKHEDTDGNFLLTITADVAPLKARMWVASAPTRDFRKAKWTKQAVTVAKNRIVGAVEPPTEGFRAFYAELDYELDGIPYSLCTQLRVVGGK